MNRRDFIKRAIGGAALAIASLYVPSKPWIAAVPKPATPTPRYLRIPVFASGRSPVPVGYTPTNVPNFGYVEYDLNEEEWAAYHQTGRVPESAFLHYPPPDS